MKTLVTILALVAISLIGTAQTCNGCQVTTRTVQAGNLEFLIETSYYSVDYAGVSRDRFDRVFYFTSNGEKKGLPLDEYAWGHVRTILSLELLNDELSKMAPHLLVTYLTLGGVVKKNFFLMEDGWISYEPME